MSMLTSQIRKLYEQGDGHFFDKENIEHHKSRISVIAYGPNANGNYYFVTSEKESQDHPRWYSVRLWNPNTPSRICTVSQYQQYKTLKAAKNAALRRSVILNQMMKTLNQTANELTDCWLNGERELVCLELDRCFASDSLQEQKRVIVLVATITHKLCSFDPQDSCMFIKSLREKIK